ncbi:MAG: PKD domain-containing protein [Acidobacteriia bacterium]|nr:PKD domain-containing protein [Terriglobia bacterium]
MSRRSGFLIAIGCALIFSIAESDWNRHFISSTPLLAQNLKSPLETPPSKDSGSASAPASQNQNSQDGQKRPLRSVNGNDALPGDDLDGPDAIMARVRWYLQRHGDNGIIDAERRLKMVREEYVKRLADEAKRNIQGTIGGINWVSIGPSNGAGRMTAVAPHPTVSGTLYVGAAGGGVWKTTDGGSTWTPLTDFINDLSVGALAVAPSDPNTIYLGSGEGGYAVDFITGIGLLKSTDGGNTWQLPSSVVAPMFYRILVNPGNAQEFVIGTNRGALRSSDGGTTFTNVISSSTYGDVTDMVRSSADPQTLFAATWDRFNWCAHSATCSMSSPKILKSTDGGQTWTEKSAGLPVSTPTQHVSRMALAISPSNPSILYVAMNLGVSTTGGTAHIFKSNDGGETWTDLTSVSNNSDVTIRTYMTLQDWYDNTLVVSPTNPDIVLAGGVGIIRTLNGGANWSRPPLSGASVHVDQHDFRYQGSVLYFANDGGIWSSPDNGNTSTDRNTGLVTRQYYSMALDPNNPNRVFAGAQDNGTGQRNDTGGTLWTAVIGGDGFQCAVNPNVPDFAYGTIQGDLVLRSKSAGSGSFSSIRPAFPTTEPLPFFSVLSIDPNQPSTIYTGTSRVWQSTNGGDSWTPLPTTSNDGSSWGTSVVDQVVVPKGNSSTIVVNRTTSIFRSSDGGSSWAKISNGLPCCINNVELDPQNSNIIYAAMAGTTGTRLWQSTNGGSTWTARDSGLPSFPTQVVRVDPTDSNDLFAGTDVGVYRSMDAGQTWHSFGNGLPNSSAHDLRITSDGSMLRTVTHGRGAWELQIPSSGNHPPTAAISSPLGTQNFNKGTTLNFTGMVSDPDAGDNVSASWTFTDNWQVTPTVVGTANASHTFSNAGVARIALTAIDNHGAYGSSSLLANVHESFESCSTPLVIPGSGPFPFSLTTSNEVASRNAGDPTTSCVSVTGHPLWLEFTPSVTANYNFNTCGTNVDTVLSVWTGNACGPYTAISGACNDDAGSGSSCQGTTASNLTVHLNSGQRVRVLVNSFGTSPGGVMPLNLKRSPAPLDVTVPSSSAISTSTANLTPLSITYGALTATNKSGTHSSLSSDPVALAIFSLTQGGTLVTEAAVPGATPGNNARVFVDYDASKGRDSGIAVVNPNSTPLTINVTAISSTGTSVPCTALQVPAQGHAARFASEFCSLTSPFLGSLNFSASAPFAAVNLRSAANTHGQPLFSGLPVIDPTAVPTGSSLIFSQIADGGGLATQILLMNTSGTAISGTIAFFNTSGNPVSLDFGPPNPVQVLNYNIVSNGVAKFSTTGLSSTINVAYAVVTPTVGQLPAGAAIFGSGTFEAGVLNAVPTTHARLYIERAASPLLRDTGIAMVNHNGSPATANLQFVSLDGTFNVSTTLHVPANGKIVQFIEQISDLSSIPANIQGVLTMTSDQPLAVITLRQTNNQVGDLLLSTLPVADLNTTSLAPLFLPQIADGAGFQTQLIFLNTTASSMSIHVDFIDDNGNLVGVLLL